MAEQQTIDWSFLERLAGAGRLADTGDDWMAGRAEASALTPRPARTLDRRLRQVTRLRRS